VTGPDRYVRRRDGRPVAAVHYTGENSDALRAWLGEAYRVTESPLGLILSRWQPLDLVAVSASDWVVDDGERVYRVPTSAFSDHCRSVPVG